MTVGKSSAAYTYTASNEMNIKNLASIAMMTRPAMKPDNKNIANVNSCEIRGVSDSYQQFSLLTQSYRKKASNADQKFVRLCALS